jgi:small conductance mechanosensitive channel
LSILTITWSMCAAASFMLGLLHLLLWQQDRRAPVYLLSVLMAASAGACALTELTLMHAASVDVYRRLLQWQNLFVFTLLMAVVWYVKARLPLARGWLAAAIAALWTVSILVNWRSPYSLVFSDITALRQMPTFWGEQFTLAVGPANPWVHVSNLASVLIVAYVIDAAVRTWRRGDPRRALLVGGSVAVFIVLGGIHAPLVDAGIVQTPYMVSFAFLAIVLALSYELVSNAVLASRYAREIQANERRWRWLLTNVHLAVIGIDPQGRITDANPFLERLTGFSAEELTGKPLRELIVARDRAELDARLLAASGVLGASVPNPPTAAPAATPTAAGAASLLGEAGVDAAAVQLPPETLNPEIDLNELEIRLVPMTRSELAALAARWQSIVKRKSEEIVAAQITVARSNGVGVEQERDRLARLADERRVLVDRFLLVLNGLEAKGATPEVISEYRAYVDALVDKTIEVSDLRTILAATGAWLTSEDDGVALATKALIALCSLYGLVLFARIVRRLAKRHLRKLPKISSLLQTFLAGLVYWVVLAAGLVVVLSLLGVKGTPLLALFGGASVIIGLALQDTLGNFAKGLMIMINRPFDEGDYVDIGGIVGTIRSVNIIATTITTFDNRVVVIPNQQVWEGVVTNLTAQDTRRVDLVFSIGYHDDIQLAIQVLGEAVAEHPLTLEEPAPTIAVTALADSAIEILCGAWTRSDDYWTVYRGLLADVKARFDAAGITIPYPQRDVHVHNAGV